MLARQEKGLEAFVRRLIDDTKKNWDTIDRTPRDFDPKAMNAWGESMRTRLNEAKAVANEVASNARDFALHNYGDKHGFDLVASMLYPYHFWYGRTYAKMMKRVARNPGILSAYSKYREYLEKKHAGLPDWWKHQLNSNELLGLDSDNPVYLNLESLLNPVNGILGVDFNDPDRQETWWGSVMDGMGKLGPSPWLPLQLAVAGLSYATSHPDQGRAFMGRLFPQGQAIKSASTFLPFAPAGGYELDPLVWMASGKMFESQDKWEERRVGRALSAIVQESNGTVTRAMADDAAHYQAGPLWEQAVRRAAEDRRWGNIAGSFGTGFKMRSQSEITIDEAYQAVHNLILVREDRTNAEYREAWSGLHQQYPFLESLLMSRKAGPLNDEAYVWSVVSRIPPGKNSEYTALVGLAPELVEQFYVDKGDMRQWTIADRNAFMGAMESLGAVLESPPDATRQEWDQAKAHYAAIFEQTPDYIEAMAESFYDMQGREEFEQARAFKKAHPELEQYLQFKEQTIFDDPILMKFYGGLNFVEGSWRRNMYARAEAIFGEDILYLQSVYFDVGKRGGDQRSFLAQHPQLAGPYGQFSNGYWGWLHQEKTQLGVNLSAIANYLPETPMANVRPDADQAGVLAQHVMNGMQDTMGNYDDQREALIESYANEPRDDNFSLSSYIDTEGEKRWPGVVALDAQFDRLAAENPLAAQSYLYTNRNLQAFRAFEKETRRNYNAAQNNARQTPTQTAQGMTWEGWKQALNPNGTSEYVPNLVVDFFRGRDMTSDLRKTLVGLWRSMGSPMGSFEGWMAKMKESWDGGY
jgi:hypothetical protein